MTQGLAPQDDVASFAELIRTMGQGKFGREATEVMQGVVKELARLAETGGTAKPKGMMTLTFKFVLDRGIMEVDPAIVVKLPATVRARTLMYPHPDGSLTRNDTRQGTLALESARDVTSDVRDIRSV